RVRFAPSAIDGARPFVDAAVEVVGEDEPRLGRGQPGRLANLRRRTDRVGIVEDVDESLAQARAGVPRPARRPQPRHHHRDYRVEAGDLEVTFDRREVRLPELVARPPGNDYLRHSPSAPS